MNKFDEEAWNQERINLQNKALEAINNLSDYMGCNNFWLPYGQGNWHVEHTPE